MKQDIKQRWVEALRSGKYQQGRRALRVRDNFCCLGVLCDIAVNAGVVGWNDRGDGLYSIPSMGFQQSLELPREVAEWAGLKSSDPVVQGSALSSHNDSGDDFAEIADMIECGL